MCSVLFVIFDLYSAARIACLTAHDAQDAHLDTRALHPSGERDSKHLNYVSVKKYSKASFWKKNLLEIRVSFLANTLCHPVCILPRQGSVDEILYIVAGKF